MPRADPKLCSVCWSHPVRAKDRCVRCYQYWHENGYDRSEDLIIRKNVRAATREFEEKAWGGPMPTPPPSEGERLRRRAEEAARERRERKRSS